MSNPSNHSGEFLHTAVVIALAGIVGLLIFFQLLRGKPMDLPSMLIIGVCFVVAVITAALLSQRTRG